MRLSLPFDGKHESEEANLGLNLGGGRDVGLIQAGTVQRATLAFLTLIRKPVWCVCVCEYTIF